VKQAAQALAELVFCEVDKQLCSSVKQTIAVGVRKARLDALVLSEQAAAYKDAAALSGARGRQGRQQGGPTHRLTF
jgi:hypothetical protein